MFWSATGVFELSSSESACTWSAWTAAAICDWFIRCVPTVWIASALKASVMLTDAAFDR